MLNLLFKLRRIYVWLRGWLTESDIAQISLYVLMTAMLLYIASTFSGLTAAIAAGGAIAYGVF